MSLSVFRDLNCAWPKDCYPQIDQLIVSTSGYEFVYILDVFQGYHQVYVDDILIKSTTVEALIADVEETFTL